MAHITIDRLVLQFPGVSENDSRRLAELIAEGLADSALTGEDRWMESLSVRLSPVPYADMETLAKWICADILQQLQTTT